MVIIGGEAMLQLSLDSLIYHQKHFSEDVFAR